MTVKEKAIHDKNNAAKVALAKSLKEAEVVKNSKVQRIAKENDKARALLKLRLAEDAEKELKAKERTMREIKRRLDNLEKEANEKWQLENWPLVKIKHKWQKRKGHFDGHKFIIE